MTTAELIALLHETDPAGGREVWLEICREAALTFTDVASSVRVDEVGDLVVSSTGPPSFGEKPHDPGHCDRGGQPHLGPCIEPVSWAGPAE